MELLKKLFNPEPKKAKAKSRSKWIPPKKQEKKKTYTRSEWQKEFRKGFNKK